MITLTTIVWEKNFEKVLSPHSFFSQYKGNKMLVVNNVTSREKLKNMLGDVSVLYVDEHKEEAKKFFGLDIHEGTTGYYYTMPYFVLLLKCPTQYIFNVSDDCAVNFQEDFITDSIEELKIPEVLTTTLEWGQDVGKGESVKESPLFYYSKGFSDQVFIADINKLKEIDYNIKDDFDFYGVSQDDSVFYGGNSFEKRLAIYMKHHNKFRAIYKKYNYKHRC